MERLPHWVLNHRFPSIHDSESKTVIEQTARVYGAMQTLIDEYNAFVQTTNKSIENFEKDVQDSNCEFKRQMTCLLENYIKSIDQKMGEISNSLDASLDARISDIVQEIIDSLPRYEGEVEDV